MMHEINISSYLFEVIIGMIINRDFHKCTKFSILFDVR